MKTNIHKRKILWLSFLSLFSTSLMAIDNREHSYDLGKVFVGDTVETEVEVCVNAGNPYAYVYVGFYTKNNWADDQYIRASLENSNPPFYMGQLTNWAATTTTKSKCRKSSVFFKPTSEGDFKAMVVGQSTSRTNSSIVDRNDIHSFKAQAVIPISHKLPPILNLLLSE